MCNSQFCVDRVTQFVKRHQESTYESYEDQRCPCGYIHFDSNGDSGQKCLGVEMMEGIVEDVEQASLAEIIE